MLTIAQIIAKLKKGEVPADRDIERVIDHIERVCKKCDKRQTRKNFKEGCGYLDKAGHCLKCAVSTEKKRCKVCGRKKLLKFFKSGDDYYNRSNTCYKCD